HWRPVRQRLNARDLHRRARIGTSVLRSDDADARVAEPFERRNGLIDQLLAVRREHDPLALAERGDQDRGGRQRLSAAGWKDEQRPTLPCTQLRPHEL